MRRHFSLDKYKRIGLSIIIMSHRTQSVVKKNVKTQHHHLQQKSSRPTTTVGQNFNKGGKTIVVPEGETLVVVADLAPRLLKRLVKVGVKLAMQAAIG